MMVLVWISQHVSEAAHQGSQIWISDVEPSSPEREHHDFHPGNAFIVTKHHRTCSIVSQRLLY